MKPGQDYISHFKPITLEEMDKVKLMNRTDTKYIFHAGLLPGILSQASQNYRILTIEKKRLFQYNSLYYDTEELNFYMGHHNGLRPRYKVRFREYVDTDVTFLEIKRKTNSGRTRKSRMCVEEIETVLSRKSHDYIKQCTPTDTLSLKPALWTHFKRLTLVSRDEDERITIDTDTVFSYAGQENRLPNLIICEVKRDASAGTSQFMRLLKQHCVYPGNMSKYCMGTVLLKENIKMNRFKAYILKINKLENEYTSYTGAVQ